MGEPYERLIQRSETVDGLPARWTAGRVEGDRACVSHHLTDERVEYR